MGRLCVRHLFEMTQHHRRPVPLRQPADFLVESRHDIVAGLAAKRFRIRHLRCPPFHRTTPGRASVRLDCDAVSDAIEPAAQRTVHAPDRAGLPQQHQECRLEDVLGIIGIVQNAAANGQDCPPVPVHQRLERGGIALGDKPVPQLGIT